MDADSPFRNSRTDLPLAHYRGYLLTFARLELRAPIQATFDPSDLDIPLAVSFHFTSWVATIVTLVLAIARRVRRRSAPP